MDISEQELLIAKIKDQINTKQDHLLEQFKDLKKNTEENEYLESVKNDYAKYFNYISSVKSDQLNAFENINKYLDKIGGELKINDSLLKETREDQKKVLGEINKLRTELDKIISE